MSHYLLQRLDPSVDILWEMIWAIYTFHHNTVSPFLKIDKETKELLLLPTASQVGLAL